MRGARQAGHSSSRCAFPIGRRRDVSRHAAGFLPRIQIPWEIIRNPSAQSPQPDLRQFVRTRCLEEGRRLRFRRLLPSWRTCEGEDLFVVSFPFSSEETNHHYRSILRMNLAREKMKTSSGVAGFLVTLCSYVFSSRPAGSARKKISFTPFCAGGCKSWA